jgi:hypothetical protein
MVEQQSSFKLLGAFGKASPSPLLLYAIQASVLSFQLDHCQIHNNLLGLRIAPGVKDINHAQFMDDTLLLGGASVQTTRNFKAELDTYNEISGSEISLPKSKIYGWNTSPREMLEISRVLGMESFTNWDSFKYLGVPIFRTKPKASQWLPLIDKLKERINSWGAKWLNLVGKVVLIKAVLASILIYQSSLLLAPATMIQKIDALFRRFLWEGGKKNGRKLHLISWVKVAKPISEGDLQFKDINSQNLALGAKLLWNLVSGKPTWSKKEIWKKYFHGPRIKCLDRPANMAKGSPIFNLCLKSLRLFKPNLTWIPGNRKKINIWEDSVLGDPPLSSMEGLDQTKILDAIPSLINLWDISVWSEGVDKTWIRWEANNKPQELEEEWNTLMGYLQGKSLIKARKKDKRGWGSLSGSYTTTTGYKILTVVPHVPPDPTI